MVSEQCAFRWGELVNRDLQNNYNRPYRARAGPVAKILSNLSGLKISFLIAEGSSVYISKVDYMQFHSELIQVEGCGSERLLLLILPFLIAEGKLFDVH